MKTRSILFSFLLLLLFAIPASAQEVAIGSDFVSRYVWRGFDFGESFSAQPALAFSAKGFEIGAWASYSLTADGAGANEADLYMSYSMNLGESGTSLSFGVTDYYFPAPDGLGFFEFDGDGAGAHWVEPFVSFSGPASAPISLTAAVMAHNDPDNSLYLEASLPVSLDSAELTFTAGGVAGESAFYGTTGADLVNLGISASRAVPINSRFELPIFVSYVLNPSLERSYLVFGFSL